MTHHLVLQTEIYIYIYISKEREKGSLLAKKTVCKVSSHFAAVAMAVETWSNGHRGVRGEDMPLRAQ